MMMMFIFRIAIHLDFDFWKKVMRNSCLDGLKISLNFASFRPLIFYFSNVT